MFDIIIFSFFRFFFLLIENCAVRLKERSPLTCVVEIAFSCMLETDKKQTVTIFNGQWLPIVSLRL